MGKYIFLFVAVVFFFGIIKNKGIVRLIWFFVGILFFQDRIILFESPTLMNFSRFLIYSLLIAELTQPKKLYYELQHFPLIRPLTVIFIGMLCIGMLDDRHGVFLNLYRSTDEFIQTFFILFLCYVNFKRSSDWEKLIKFFLISAIILCIYGFLNYSIKANPLDSFISKTYNSFSYFDQYALSDGRFRINSFVSHPIYYGYLSGILLLLCFYSFFFKENLKKLCLITMPLIFINLILANSRTPMIAFVVGLFIFIVIALKTIVKIRLLTFGSLICLAIYNIPLIQEKIDNSLDIFKTGGEKTEGSSLAMRTIQLNASYGEFLKKPFSGNGLYYIKENLSWSSNPENRIIDDDFQGFESYIYQLLIEQGLIGIITNAIFFISIIIYFLERRLVQKEFSALGLAIILMFLTFIIGTGTLNSWVISMGLIGILIKYLELKHIELSLT